MFRVGVFVFFFFISAVWQSQTNLPTHFLNFLWDGSDFVSVVFVGYRFATLLPLFRHRDGCSRYTLWIGGLVSKGDDSVSLVRKHLGVVQEPSSLGFGFL